MNFIQIVEQDITNAWVATEHFVEDEALVAWTVIKGVFNTLLPSQWVILINLLGKIEKDVMLGSIGDIETALLNDVSATAATELLWIEQLGSEVIQAVIALYRAHAVATAINAGA